MTCLFLEYPKCSTCRNAKKWLDQHHILYEDRDIVVNNPAYDELKEWVRRSGLPVKSFFNTSGQLYRALQLKDKLPLLTEEEQLKLLASDGKLVKRPLLIGENRVWVGFRVEDWENIG
ncbi:arsenate reductase family protein [uncultured Sanguibacteroides sp.]|uniref:arsenate reductase family protein n=1 Tax=uncultured Sanguibacteroides sp. TaxID=1635151 RepID=UPI0025EA4A93|nr:arsenate reductase family protein [uncultured Sanguibacteroides sp.]